MTSECFDLQPSLSARLDGALPEEEAQRLDEHLAGCLGCQSERDALELVAKQVRALPRLEVPTHFTAGVMARVIEEPSASAAPPGAAQATGSEAAKATGSGAAKGRARAVPVAKLVEPTGDAPDLVLPDVGEGPYADDGEDAAPATPPSVCDQLAEDRSALLDNALARVAATRVKEHLAECEVCRADQAALQRLRDRVGAVPRMDVPPDFLQGVMDKVDAYEFSRQQQEQQSRDARAKSLKMLSSLAQAASFLLILTGGMYFASPDTPDRAYLPPGFQPEPGLVRKRMAEAPPSLPPLPPPLPRGDAEWELTVASLEQGHQTARTMATHFANFRDERPVQREEQRTSGFLLNVARNRIDDLHQGLDQAQEVQTNAQSLAAMEQLHTEQDQVVLKSGFVLVGQLQRDDRSGVRINSGGAVRQVARKDVERVETAAERRRLRILLHERD